MKNFGCVLRGSETFWTCRKGGGRKISDLTYFFGSLKFIVFSCVFIGFGIFLLFRSKGGGRKISDTSRRGGAKNFGRVLGGGIKSFRTSIFPESLGK